MAKWPTVHSALNPVAGDGLETTGSWGIEPTLAGARDYGPSNGMFGVLLQGCGEPERVVLGEVAAGTEPDNPVLTQRECAGLVEHHRIEEPCLLQSSAVAH